MAVCKEDLQEFQRFASKELSNGGADSLGELVVKWEAHREREQAALDIRESHGDIEAGRIRPLDEACSDIRKNFAKYRSTVTRRVEPARNSDCFGVAR